MRILIVIPAYNEQENIERVVDQLMENYPQYDYLVVNDVLEESVRQVHEIIQSEHYRVERNHLTIKKMQEDLKKFERSM